MKSKDQQLLEEAYKSIYNTKYVLNELYYLDEAGLWKKAAPYAAALGLAASALGVGGTAPKDVKPYDVSNSIVHTNNSQASHSEEHATLVNSITNVIESHSGDQMSSVAVEIIESTDLEDGSKDVIVEISGDVFASSQQEANQLASAIVSQAMKKARISVNGLSVMESNPTKFSVKLRAKLIIK